MTNYVLVGATLVLPDRLVTDGALVVVQGQLAFAGPRADLPQEIAAATGIPTSTLKRVDVSGKFIIPGYIDVHVHGGGGADTMDATPAAIETLAAVHARFGTTGLLATTVTESQDRLEAAVKNVAAVIADNRYQGARVLGMHLEGPYINEAKVGAQNPAFVRTPDLGEIQALWEASQGHLRLVTMAPEVEGVREVVAFLRNQGVVVSMGHTNGTYAQARAAIEMGMTHATHAFNAMTGLHHRNPGVVGAVLEDDTVWAELIADGVHVHPAAMRILVQGKGFDRVSLVTDAIRAMGQPDGEYDLGGLRVTVCRGQCRLESGALAGSVLTMQRAVQNLVRDVHVPLHAAVKMASLNQAIEFGWDDRIGSLTVGKEADFAVLDSDLAVISTWVGGRMIYGASQDPPEGA